MPKPDTNNRAGHRSKYEVLAANLPHDEVGVAYVGGGDPVRVGFEELEVLRTLARLEGASIVDIGCGIGRLTMHLSQEPISAYLGLDIIPEILERARSIASQDARFRFEIAEDCRIPLGDAAADVAVGFSLITHLIDEEVYSYFRDTRRVLRAGGTAVFTFFDLDLPAHQDVFFSHAEQYRSSHGDMLKFSTKPSLQLFATHAGFSHCAFIDGGTQFTVSKPPPPAFDSNAIKPTFSWLQSICVMRA